MSERTPRPTDRQRGYLETLMQRADITWDSLCEAAGVTTSAAHPWDSELSFDEAHELIGYLVKEVGN